MFQKTSGFTNRMFYVRNISIRSYTINKITFIINTITTTTIIIIIIIIITIIIISSLSSSSSVSFFISSTSEVRVHLHPSYLNSYVFFLTTCFLLFIGFRYNILLMNIYIDLLLLTLVFLRNFSTFNKRYSK